MKEHSRQATPCAAAWKKDLFMPLPAIRGLRVEKEWRSKDLASPAGLEPLQAWSQYFAQPVPVGVLEGPGYLLSN